MVKLIRRAFFRHPLAAIGAALAIAGFFVFFSLFLMDLSIGADNPYTSLVTFIAAPSIIMLGLLLFLAAWLAQVRKARKRGETVQFSLTVDPSNPHPMATIWKFLGLTIVLGLAVSYIGFRAYESTESQQFCGQTCHTVMEPQFIAYQNSAHARVLCVECHIGSGTSFWIKAKVDGLRQVWAASMDTYSKPIETPVPNLRPAQQTCESCHWPKQFYGDKLLAKTYYSEDEENSPWTINLRMKIGGGNPRTGRLEGIHWHMLQQGSIEYIATDRKREEISWIRVTDLAGRQEIYTDPDSEPPDTTNPDVEIRTFDCMDCHNRPAHQFLPPATALNMALSTRQISPTLPYVRKVGLELLTREYETRQQANATIAEDLPAYYREEYPAKVNDLLPEISQATASLLNIYNLNFFPEMKTDFRARQNNLSHFVDDGCFRCHDNVKQTSEGKKITRECTTCHLIVAQGPSEDLTKLESNLGGLEFKHPEDIDEEWKEYKCAECHTREDGY